jgi:hypothetical protein
LHIMSKKLNLFSLLLLLFRHYFITQTNCAGVRENFQLFSSLQKILMGQSTNVAQRALKAS